MPDETRPPTASWRRSEAQDRLMAWAEAEKSVRRKAGSTICHAASLFTRWAADAAVRPVLAVGPRERSGEGQTEGFVHQSRHGPCETSMNRTARRSSGSSLADNAVEPTTSQNITVSWRRSAVPCGAGFGSAGSGPGAAGVPASSPIARSIFSRCPREETPRSLRS